MPHIIVEHSCDISKNSIINLQKEIQNIMASVTDGNFDIDQCKARSHAFDEYLVGKSDQTTSSFIHVTIKILSGRTLEAKKKLAEKVVNFSKNFCLTDKRCDVSVDIVDMDRNTYQKVRFG